ncbi:MAG TPA: hypothetical protein VK982_06535 [Bacteroidales bacterium]|nr:hypothetical protein [Bacteroidales bacterium]
MNTKKRVALYLTNTMHQELKGQADKLGLDMGSYVVHLLMREKDRNKNETMMKELLQTTQKAMNNPKVLSEFVRKQRR